MKDAREATVAVRQYFEQAHGPFGVNLFQVERVTWDESSREWTIECSFFPTIAMTQKAYYKVTVSEDGSIRRVDKTPSPEVA
ncbi:MAG: hypothetical protein HYX92_16765 [Chloroflexi bacterium]|nr:hypothetical protein [Chloroflexota bacterium]